MKVNGGRAAAARQRSNPSYRPSRRIPCRAGPRPAVGRIPAGPARISGTNEGPAPHQPPRRRWAADPRGLAPGLRPAEGSPSGPIPAMDSDRQQPCRKLGPGDGERGWGASSLGGPEVSSLILQGACRFCRLLPPIASSASHSAHPGSGPIAGDCDNPLNPSNRHKHTVIP